MVKRLIHGKLTIGIVIDDGETLKQVNGILHKNFPPQEASTPVAVLGQWSDLTVGLAMLKDCRPNIAIIGLCTKENAGAHALAEGISSALPDTQIFMIGKEKDPESMLRAMRAGVKEYLTAPVDSEELLDSINRATVTLEHKRGVKGPHVIGVLSAKGGCGCTTVAVNVAAALRFVTKKRVLLLDFCVGGDVALFLNLRYQHTLKDVIENLNRLDKALLTSYTIEHSSGLRVIPPMETEDSMLKSVPTLNRDILDTLMGHLDKENDYIVIDIGAGISKEKVELLKLLDIILLVFPLELSALRTAKQQLIVLDDLGLLEKTRLVANRYDKRYSKGAGVIALDDVRKTLNKPVFCTIANDYLLVSECINLGTLIVTEKRKSPITQDYIRLAELLTKGNAAEVAAQKDGKERG